MPGSERRKSITRTIRIDAENETALITEAERRGYSVNALIGNVIERYLNSLRYNESAGMISFSSETLQGLIKNLEKDTIRVMGEETGGSMVASNLMQRGRKVNYENVVWYITKVLGEYNGWFRCDYNVLEDKQSFHLTHVMGYNWSVFLESYLKSVFDEVLGIKLNSVIMNNAVNLEVRK